MAELNAPIKILVVELNARQMRDFGASRAELFPELDKPKLTKLLDQAYAFARWKRCRVGPDYHIKIDGHWYSAPYRLIRELVDARIDGRTVEIFHNGRRIASHARAPNRRGHTTVTDHMPSAHRRYGRWTPAGVIAAGERIGPPTAAFFQAVIAAPPHPEQGFRTCLGILSLVKSYGAERVDAACRRGILIKARSVASIRSSSRTAWIAPFLDEPSEHHPRATATSAAGNISTEAKETCMLNHPTHERLIELGSSGMAKAFEEQRRSPDLEALPFEDRIGLPVDREAAERDIRRLTTRLKLAALRQNACVEDVDLRTPRGIDRAVFAKLVSRDWIDRHENLLITGATDLRKSWLACALGHKACRDNRSVLYHASQDCPKRWRSRGAMDVMPACSKHWARPASDSGRLGVVGAHRRRAARSTGGLEDRHGRASTIVTSQLPVDTWRTYRRPNLRRRRPRSPRP